MMGTIFLVTGIIHQTCRMKVGNSDSYSFTVVFLTSTSQVRGLWYPVVYMSVFLSVCLSQIT